MSSEASSARKMSRAPNPSTGFFPKRMMRRPSPCPAMQRTMTSAAQVRQTVTVEGYLAADPSILSAQETGRKRASFRLLETTRFRRVDGQLAERTTGFNCVCFSEAAAENYIALYARKGVRAVVTGHVENDTWTGKNGVIHYDLRPAHK